MALQELLHGPGVGVGCAVAPERAQLWALFEAKGQNPPMMIDDSRLPVILAHVVAAYPIGEIQEALHRYGVIMAVLVPQVGDFPGDVLVIDRLPLGRADAAAWCCVQPWKSLSYSGVLIRHASGKKSSSWSSARVHGHSSGNVASGKPVSLAAWRRARR